MRRKEEIIRGMEVFMPNVFRTKNEYINKLQ